MRELSFGRRGARYLFPVAILRPGSSSDITPYSATALLDTGATVSGIGPNVVQRLGLRTHGKKLLRSATEERFVAYYFFRVGFYTSEEIAEPGRSDLALPYIFEDADGFSWTGTADFDVIIGMDILSQCEVRLDRSGRCRLLFG